MPYVVSTFSGLSEEAIITGLARAKGGSMQALTPQFEYVPLEGLHFEDLFWPLFMFLVGVSIHLSIAKRKASGTSYRSLNEFC